ncbi:hypothetical protein V8D89_004098 [Ganoderma adspersum]
MSVPHPLSQPLALNRLQRISLQLPNILDKLGEFYLSLFPIRTPQNVPIALQVLNHHWYDIHHDVETLLKDATGGAASHLSFSMYPLPDRSSLNILFFAITAAGPQGTFHIATVPFYDYDSRLPGPDWDFNQSAALKSILGRGLCLPAVRELWISGVHPVVDRHTHIAAAFKTAIAGLSALETVVLVEPVQGYPPSGSTLGLCPDALDGGGAGGSESRSVPPPNLRTLRLVYGDGGTHWLRDWDGDVNQLDLGRLLAELETGAYAYFDTLVLEMRPWLDVGLEDLQRLKGHFATVERRYYVDRTPTMPLPDYCVERYGGSGGTRSWLGSFLIADVINTLTGLIATLREDLNSRIPLFQLPAEILQRILEEVPDPLFECYEEFQPFWHSGAMDTSMLIPVLQTCRQFRRIALSHTSLWKTIYPTSRYALPPPILLQKGCDIPLIVVIDGASTGEVLGILDEVEVPRMQELHVFELYIHYHGSGTVAKIDRFFRSGLPLLESISLSGLSTSDEEDEDTDEDECPFPLDAAPRLRHMMLKDVSFIPRNAFPHLTHLSLSGIHTPDCHHYAPQGRTVHANIANLLSRCPNLESLAICSPSHSGPPPNLPASFPPPLSLNRLRRITLELPRFRNPITDFYLSLFPLDGPACQPTAFQILELAEMDDAPALGQMLSRVTKAEASHLSLSLHPHPRGRHWKYLSVSAAGPKGTFHACTESFWGMDVEPREELCVSPKPFLDAIVCGCAHLRAVREVWVTSVHPRTARRLYRDATEHFKAAIAALPALETAVVVVAVVGAELSDLEVGLGLLPSVHDPGFASPNLKTLRINIVHGNGTRTGKGKKSVEKIRLTKLLDEIGTGAYGHFENVLLQVMRPLEVDEEDLARLEACFRRVAFQRIHSMPTMPLPEYCKEPYAGPGGSSEWIGSLW